MIQIYNEITKKKEEFLPQEKGRIKMYVCGPTVYNYFHVGNARCFVMFDFIRRFFEFMGYDVTYVQNFTDIDDKMIKKANAENSTVAEIAKRYIAEYMTDAAGLGIKPATVHPLATGHMDEIIEIIETLEKKGHAYSVAKGNGDRDVYFSTESFAEYGKLSGADFEELESGARVDVDEDKRSPFDFALWKSKKAGEPFWQSPWGEGRPGWHIECSAMAKKYLGSTVDFHCGGKDLMFPHHENEIAQSECANDAEFTRYWLHNGFISIDNKKMSKSEGNFFTVREISEKYGYMPIRYFLLASTYRTPVNFSEEIIGSAKNSLERIFTFGENVAYLKSTAKADENEGDGEVVASLRAHFDRLVDALCDDFNTADAISCFFEFIREANTKLLGTGAAPSKKLLGEVSEIYRKVTDLFGFSPEIKHTDGISDDEINSLIAQRTEAKKAKNFKEADRIREMLKDNGITLEDTPTGTKFRRN